MCYPIGNFGAEDDADEGSGYTLAQDPGGGGIEDAAAGKADDVVKEAQGAVKGTVLVVDAGVDVAEVCGVDEFGGGLVKAGDPGAELDGGWECGGLGQGWGGDGEVALEEEAGEDAEAGVEEGLGQGAGVVKEELGLDAVDVGGGFQDFEEVAGEGVGDGERRGGVGQDENVADDGLGAFIDAEAVADDAAAKQGDEAREDLLIEVLEEKLGGGGIVPAEALAPEDGFFLEDGAELGRLEVPEVKDLDLWG